MTVFERRARAGGAFHDVPRTPLFQNVEPRAYAFEALVDSLERRCREHGAELRYRTDALRDPGLLAGFDRVVIATGATYRVGLGPLIRALLRGGLLTRWPLRSLASRAAVRDWLYHRARRGVEAESVRQLASKVKLQVIGDAAAPGRSQAAIESAFRAAYDRTQGLG